MSHSHSSSSSDSVSLSHSFPSSTPLNFETKVKYWSRSSMLSLLTSSKACDTEESGAWCWPRSPEMFCVLSRFFGCPRSILDSRVWVQTSEIPYFWHLNDWPCLLSIPGTHSPQWKELNAHFSVFLAIFLWVGQFLDIAWHHIYILGGIGLCKPDVLSLNNLFMWFRNTSIELVSQQKSVNILDVFGCPQLYVQCIKNAKPFWFLLLTIFPTIQSLWHKHLRIHLWSYIFI